MGKNTTVGIIFIACLAAAATAQSPPDVSTPAAAVAHFDGPGLWHLARGVEIGGTLRLDAVPLDGEARTLDLVRFRVFAPDARVTVRGAAGVSRRPAPDNAYFRGAVDGDPASLALLTVRAQGGLRGLVTSGGNYWVLGSGAGGPAVRRIDAETEFAGETTSFRCGADELEIEEIFDAGPGSGWMKPAAAGSGLPVDKGISHTARVAIETDWEYFQLFGNVADATDYAGDLIAYSSTVYSGELSTSMEIVDLTLWQDSSDPWTQTPGLCGLYEFGRWWNDNRGGVERTIAHFLSGKNPNSGIAWIGVLCSGGFNTNHNGNCPDLTPTSDNYGGAYGYSGGIDGNFDILNPAIVWDIYVVSHEIGHNFRSPHTHCYGNVGGNSEPVDECSAIECGQNGCFCGTPSLPCGDPGGGCGTIMSYCHLLSGGLGNVSLTLGLGHPWGVEPERVPNRMSDHVVARAGSNPGCLDPIFEPDAIFVDGFETGDTSAWTTTFPE